MVRRLVDQAINQSNLEALDDVSAGDFAEAAREWIRAFRQSFPDFRMEIIDLIAEGDRVVAHFTCSGTHEREWLGYPPTGRLFEAADEMYISREVDRKSLPAAAVEDNPTRLQQLGLCEMMPSD